MFYLAYASSLYIGSFLATEPLLARRDKGMNRLSRRFQRPDMNLSYTPYLPPKAAGATNVLRV